MEANLAHYVLHGFKKWPSEFFALSREERAFVIASIDIQIEKEKEVSRKKSR